MSNRLAVLLEGQQLGEIEQLKSGSLRLHHTNNYLSTSSATPLSISMPPSATPHGGTQITPWLWGLLPDNADVLARWSRDFSVSAASPFPLLGTQVGHDCAGAVQFCAPTKVGDLATRGGTIDWLSEANNAPGYVSYGPTQPAGWAQTSAANSVLAAPNPRWRFTATTTAGVYQTDPFLPPTF